MKPRYAKQRCDWDCAAVAIVNALKWVGCSVSYRQHKKHYVKLLNLKPYGIFESDYTRFLKTNKYAFKLTTVKKGVNISDIKKYINKDQIVILGVHFKESSHIGLVVDKDDDTVTLVNFFGKTYQKMSDVSFQKHFNKNTIAYVIRR